MPRTTLNDIARLLNVSKVTVSKALRDHPDVSEGLKLQIRKLAQDMGYTPNYIARNLSSKKTHTIGVVVPDVSNIFFSYAVHGIIDSATEKGYQIIVTISREDDILEKRNINTLISMRVDGLLVSISQKTSDLAIFEAIKHTETPLVFFDRHLEGTCFSSVVANDCEAAFQVVSYGIAKGYRKIVHLAGACNTSVGRERCAGYQKAMAEHGLAESDGWIIENGFTKEDGIKGARALLGRDEKPELIFAVNGHVASGAYQEIKSKGMSIPGDIGIIGFGFKEFTDTFIPPLTIMSENPELLGRTAFATLLKEIEGGDADTPQRIVLPLELEVRSSC